MSSFRGVLIVNASDVRTVIKKIVVNFKIADEKFNCLKLAFGEETKKALTCNCKISCTRYFEIWKEHCIKIILSYMVFN